MYVPDDNTIYVGFSLHFFPSILTHTMNKLYIVYYILISQKI